MEAEIVKYEAGSQGANALITMPVMRVQHFLERRQAIKEMLQQVMVDGVDYGTIPGTPKPTLLKAGAEKLLQMFGFTLELVPVEIIENWGTDTDETFLYYKYEAVLRRPGLEVPICRYTGLAHSRETKWRYRWVPEVDVPPYLDKATLASKPGTASEFVFAINKAETSGKYAKPPEYWEMFRLAIRENRARRFQRPMKGKTADAIEIDVTVYRIPNPEVPDQAHTISAIAQKRAVVGATRYATNASDIFEVKDDTGEDDERPLDGEYSYVDKQEKAERQARVDRASGKTPGPGAEAFPDVEKEKDSLYEKQRKVKPLDAIRQAYGKARTGKDAPPAAAVAKEQRSRLEGLGLDPELVAKTIFEKGWDGLSAAHVQVLADTSDQDIVDA